MNFPNVPTDSLYKFFALGGLFSTALVVIYYEKSNLAIDELLVRAKNGVELLNVDIDYLNHLVTEQSSSIVRDRGGRLPYSSLPRWNKFKRGIERGEHPDWSLPRINRFLTHWLSWMQRI